MAATADTNSVIGFLHGDFSLPIGPYKDFAECKADIKTQYRKRHPDWTEEHLDQVAGAVCATIEKNTQAAAEVRFAYQARFEPYERQGKFFVKVHNIDDSVNRLDWGVTPQARTQSLASFFDQPLLGPPELSEQHVIVSDPRLPHYGEHAIIGHPVDVQNNGATYGIYEVTVPKAVDMIKNGLLSSVSPSVLIKKAHENENGSLIIDDFTWDHTLFVDVGAFPKAGVVATCEGPSPESCGFGRNFGTALQAAYRGHGQKPRQDVGTQSPKGMQSSREKIVRKLEGNKLNDQEKDEQGKCKECEALQAKVTKLEQDATAAATKAAQAKETEKETVKAKDIDLKELQGKYEKLLEWQNETLQAQLTERATAIADLEMKAGRLEQAKKAERVEALKKVGIVGLDAMQAALGPLVEALQEAKPLKAGFEDPAQASNVEEQVRQAMFGYKRDWKELDPATGLGKISGGS